MQEVTGPYVLSLWHTINGIFCLWRVSPPSPNKWVNPTSFTRFLDHTHRRTTIGRSRDLYLTTHNTHNRYPRPRWETNPQSQQASGRRTTPYTLEPELFFLILAHPVYKMWIIQEPNMLELWNKLHFEEKKKDSIYTMFKIFSTYIGWINI